MPRTLLLLAALVAIGCGEEEAKKVEYVPLAQAPPDLLKIAKAKRPDLNFEGAWRVKFRGKDAFEFRGKSKTGETHEVEISPEGEVLEIE